MTNWMTDVTTWSHDDGHMPSHWAGFLVVNVHVDINKNLSE